ncbi:MAG: TonB-dependent receptor [Chitinophagaceae bacterium]|nr:TonB-dependent receptor [Chitinophagaceae bacterium]MCW5905470.1 TonB-dependent receptor [Chitinophagaceae bacterium]
MSKKILTLIALSAAIYATAQKDTLHGGKLDDVIVTTANKVAQKQSTTGKVITVISKEQIEKSSAKTVSQLLNEQAGIVINGALNNAGNVQTVYMRGASAGRTLILMDGIPMNDPSTITNDYDLNLFSINDIEQIEICKGAQSTLYGSDAIAGVINIITVKKDIDKAINIKATTAFGTKNTTRNNVQLFGKVKKLLYTARFAQLKTDGFSSAYDSAGNKNFDNDGYKGNIANASFQYQATNQLSFRTFVQHSNYKADIDAGVFADKRNYFINNKVLNTGVGFHYTTSKLNVVGNYQYSQTRRHYDDGFDAGLPAFSTNDYNGIGNFYELYASYKIDKQFTVLLGNDYRFATMDGAYYSSSWGASPYKDTSMNQYSAYASVLFNSVNNKFNVELGGRINKHSRYGDNSTFTFNPSYNINNQWKLFASVSSGFKSPSIYQLYDTWSGNKDLKAEKSINYEAGVQYADKEFNTRAVFFSRKIDNGIDYNYITFQYFNYVKQEVTGLELEFTFQPLKELNISANYTLLSPHETTQNRVTNIDTVKYNYLLRRPKNMLNLNIGWQATKALHISVNSKYVENRFDVGGYMMPDVKLKNYFLLNAYAEYVLSNSVKLFTDIQNISNTKFYDVNGYNSIPTMANIGVTFNW